MPQDKPITRMDRLRRQFEPDFVHSPAARIVAGTLVCVGLLVAVLGLYDWHYFRYGIIMAICGNSLRLVNIGTSIKEDEDKLTPKE